MGAESANSVYTNLQIVWLGLELQNFTERFFELGLYTYRAGSDFDSQI